MRSNSSSRYRLLLSWIRLVVATLRDARRAVPEMRAGMLRALPVRTHCCAQRMVSSVLPNNSVAELMTTQQRCLVPRKQGPPLCARCRCHETRYSCAQQAMRPGQRYSRIRGSYVRYRCRYPAPVHGLATCGLFPRQRLQQRDAQSSTTCCCVRKMRAYPKRIFMRPSVKFYPWCTWSQTFWSGLLAQCDGSLAQVTGRASITLCIFALQIGEVWLNG